MSKRITVMERRAIFQALVRAQDRGESVNESRQQVSKRFHVTEYTLRKIEDEGIARQWPPLDEDVSKLSLVPSQSDLAERN